DYPPVSARENRRGPRRHPRGRCGQDHPGDRMSFAARLDAELAQFKRDGVYKRLNYLEAPQAARTKMQGRGEVVILSSNNYLGLCNAPDVVAAGKRALDEFGAGTGSVRFFCGTFTIHRELEQALARFVGCESSLTYVSCWNANEGLVPTLLGEQDIVISDQQLDRKSTRLNSSHLGISYAVFCLKKKRKEHLSHNAGCIHCIRASG